MGDNSDNSFFTEKDLIRQVASNITKEQITGRDNGKFNEELASKGKQIML